ncbi:MAG: hypothetical protein JWP89_7035, partial [Schlesneria sp.]|nr:hypothetical protein [Schlesneria sp.]
MPAAGATVYFGRARLLPSLLRCCWHRVVKEELWCSVLLWAAVLKMAVASLV